MIEGQPNLTVSLPPSLLLVPNAWHTAFQLINTWFCTTGSQMAFMCSLTLMVYISIHFPLHSVRYFASLNLGERELSTKWDTTYIQNTVNSVFDKPSLTCQDGCLSQGHLSGQSEACWGCLWLGFPEDLGLSFVHELSICVCFALSHPGKIFCFPIEIHLCRMYIFPLTFF